MFHPLFVPRYLDYVATESEGGGLLRPVTSCLEGLFHFTVCLLRSHSLSNIHPSLSFPVMPNSHTHPMTFYHKPKSLFLSLGPSIHPSILSHSSILLSFLRCTSLCSAVTLSSLPHVLLQAYSVLDAGFCCHSVYTGTL